MRCGRCLERWCADMHADPRLLSCSRCAGKRFGRVHFDAAGRRVQLGLRLGLRVQQSCEQPNVAVLVVWADGWKMECDNCSLCPAIASYCPSRAAPQFGSISCSGVTGRSVGDVCVSGCNAGYYATGGAGLTSTASQTCNTSTTAVGVWSPANPTCMPNGPYCPVIVGANGTVTSSYRLAATASFTCRAGLNLFGPPQLLYFAAGLLECNSPGVRGQSDLLQHFSVWSQQLGAC
jgi:hypothetical protein